MKNLLTIILFFGVLFSATAQEKEEENQKLYQKFYLEVNPVGATTFYEIIFPARKQIVIPRTVEIGFNFTDRFNINFGYEADRFARLRNSILPLFSRETLTTQKGYIVYAGLEYFLLKRKEVLWNVGTKVFYGNYTKSTVYTNPDFAQSFFINEDARKIGLGVDMVLLFPLTNHVALSINPIYGRIYSTSGNRNTFDEDIFIMESADNLDIRAELFSQIGLRFNL